MESGAKRVSDAVDVWLKLIEPEVKLTSFKRYETLFTRYLIPTYGDIDGKELTEEKLNILADDLRDVQSLSDRTVSSIITTTRRVIHGEGKAVDTHRVNISVKRQQVNTLSDTDVGVTGNRYGDMYKDVDREVSVAGW